MKSLIALLFALLLGITSTLQGTSPPQSPCIFPQDRKNLENKTTPCVIVIFGATGDLTERKLLPAIYNLAREGNLSQKTAVVGFARGAHTHETFRMRMGDALDQFSKIKPKETDFWHHFENQVFYNQSDFEQDQGYENLKKLLINIDQEFGTLGNRIYYLATPPSHFPTIIKKLYEHQLVYGSSCTLNNWSRVIIEKPFGNDLDSAINLLTDISKYLDEDQVYLMDHYLGKEGVQYLLNLRFENASFEPFWNNKFIDNIQITLSEDIGIGTRSQLWEETGSLRDIFQNHLIQLLAIIAMEPPASLEKAPIYEEKIKVLNAIRPFPLDQIDSYVIRGQYGPGEINGISVPGYKQEKGVSASSEVETFVAAKIFIDNPRWEKIPFYIRGGKRLPKQTTEIVIIFKNCNSSADHDDSNALFIRIQPNPTIFHRTLSKDPMLNKSIEIVPIGYGLDPIPKKSAPEAYEKLLEACVQGDHSLYVQAEEQLAAWRLLTPVLHYWKSHPDQVPNYKAGTWGPLSADQMLRENGHHWQLLES
jgi:glucose-6-phosphate 1-dehydrogenase